MKKIIIIASVFLIGMLLIGCEAIDQTSSPTTIESTYLDTTTEVLSLYDIELLDSILDEANDIQNLMGVTVSLNGERLADHYYNVLEIPVESDVYSVTKSILSLITGIAIDKGYIDSVDDYLSDYIDISGYENEEDLSSIQIKHLLTMSDGIYWNPNDLSGELIGLRNSDNPKDYILNREISFSPGTYFNYSGGAAHLMSMVISEATQMKTLDFAYLYLFEPLGIEKPTWIEDHFGVNIGGSDIYLSNEDLDKIGQLVINQGIYSNQEIVSSHWINESTTSRDFAPSYYGYFWWLSNSNGYKLISARGYAGQYIYIVPDLDLVITVIASGYVFGTDLELQVDAIQSLILDEIIPIFI